MIEEIDLLAAEIASLNRLAASMLERQAKIITEQTANLLALFLDHFAGALHGEMPWWRQWSLDE